MASVFDVLPNSLDVDEDVLGDEDIDDDTNDNDNDNDNGEKESKDSLSEKKRKLAEYYKRRHEAHISKEWGGKRLLLAMVDKAMGGEGTVVYYIVQEGVVKPRQN